MKGTGIFMKKKLSVGQKRLLVCLVIVAIFVLTYQFIYIKFEDQAANYKARTDEVEQQIAQRKSDLAQEDTWTLENEELKQQIDGTLTSYPVKLTKEDNLIFIEKMEKKLKISTLAVDVLDTTVFYTTKLPIRNEAGLDMLTEAVGISAIAGDSSTDITMHPAGADSVDVDNENADSAAVDSENADSMPGMNETKDIGNADSEATDRLSSGNGVSADIVENTAVQPMVALVCPINISMQITEKELLKLIQYIRNYPELTTIGDTNLNYDSSTGKLICNMTINRYVLVGSGREYEEPDIGDISIGTDSLFGTPPK